MFVPIFRRNVVLNQFNHDDVCGLFCVARVDVVFRRVG